MGERLSEIDVPSWFASKSPRWLIQAIVGLAACGIAMVLRGVLEALVIGVIPFALLFPSVMIATLLAGWPAGGWTTVLGSAGVWYFLFEPRRSFAVTSPADGVSLALFICSAAVIIAVAEAYRRSARALAAERAQQAILIHELNHRVKNTLATVQSIAAMTFGRSEGGGAKTLFEGRLHALSRAHDILTAVAWEPADVMEVAPQALTPFYDPGRLHVSGPSARLSPSQVLGLSMALHELATNAVKYGALSGETGEVWASWTVDGDRLRFRWEERGGPPVEAPARRGFGSRLLQHGLARELNGDARLTFAPSGLIYELEATLARP